MDYTTIIRIKADKGLSNKNSKDIVNLQQALLPEIKNNKWQRSSFTIKKEKKELIIEIHAQDAGALRATFNSITKLIAVYDKIKELK